MDLFLHTIGSTVATAPTKKPQPHEAPEKSDAAGTLAAEDSVEASLQLHSLAKNLMSSPVVDSDRVSRVSNAIASGHYQVDPQRAASRLMELEALTP